MRRSRSSRRRERVLEAMGSLWHQGHAILRLDRIRQEVERLFPGEDEVHLDQVVRDLANKTELVERCDRGSFRLTDTGLEIIKK